MFKKTYTNPSILPHSSDLSLLGLLAIKQLILLYKLNDCPKGKLLNLK